METYKRLLTSVFTGTMLLVALGWLLQVRIPDAHQATIELSPVSTSTPIPLVPITRRDLGFLGYDNDMCVTEGTGPSVPGRMCASVVTGTFSAIWIFTNTSGALRNLEEYHTPTFDQDILSRSDTAVKVKITSKAVVDTNTAFPLDTAQLPSDIRKYLQPTSAQQSDNPAIVQEAKRLVEGAQMEAQAVVAILDWVRANIEYDYTFSLPVDAVSVYQNRSGVCAGFSNLAVALLRAAGIPARGQAGCALWALPSGGGHAWIEVYYPDVGWVPSDPQGDENFVNPNHWVIHNWWDWCGHPETTITYTEYIRGDALYSLRTSYSDMAHA